MRAKIQGVARTYCQRVPENASQRACCEPPTSRLHTHPPCDTPAPAPHRLTQTLNLENYEMAMFMIIRASNYGAAAYFISWIVLGAATRTRSPADACALLCAGSSRCALGAARTVPKAPNRTVYALCCPPQASSSCWRCSWR